MVRRCRIIGLPNHLRTSDLYGWEVPETSEAREERREELRSLKSLKDVRPRKGKSILKRKEDA